MNPNPHTHSPLENLAMARAFSWAAARHFNDGKIPAARFVAIVLCAVVAALMPRMTSAATIYWGAPTTLSGDADVNANGTASYAYFLGTGNQTVNGVTFTASSGNATWGNVSFNSGFTGTASGLAGSAYINPSTAYSNLLNGAVYGGAVAGTVTLNGLIPNEAYAVQIWVNDSRAAGGSRTEIASNSVASTVTLTYNNYGAIGGVGQYVVGTFVADNTSNSFTLIPSASGSVQLNAISLRDLGGPIKTWLGSSDTSWGTGANWSPSGAPISGQSIVFNELSSANLATMPNQNYTFANLTLSNAPSAVSIGASGFTLTINNGVNLLTSGQSLTINDPVVLGNFETWTNNGNLTLNGGVSGSAALTLAGTGVTTFSQPATYLYRTTIGAGTLALAGSGSLTSSNILVAGGATLDVSAETTVFALAGHNLANTSSGAIISGANNCTSGTLSLTYDGVSPSFIQTNGTMTISSTTVVNVNIPGSLLTAGTHTLIGAAAAGNVGQVAVSDFLPAVVVTGNGAVGAASLQIDGSGNLNLVIATPDVWTGATDGNWSTAGNWIPGNEPNPGDSILFNNLSVNHLTLSQNDTAAGGAIYGLSLINPAGPVTIGGPGSLSVSSGGLNLSSAGQNLSIAAPLVINANQSWILTNSRTLTLSGPVSGVSGGNVTVSGGGTVKMGAANVLNGLTNLASNLGDFTVNSSTLDLNGNSQAMNGLNGDTNAVVDNSSAGAVTLTIGGNTDSSTFSGSIRNSGGGSLSLQANGGTISLSPSNSYTGGSIFNNGALLSFPSSATLGSGPITFNAGATIYSAAVTFTNALTLNGGYLRLGGNNDNQTWSGPITVQNGFQMSGDNSGCQILLSGPINIGTGGIGVTNFGNEGPQGGGGVGLGDVLSGPISGSGGIIYYCNGGNSRLTVQGANTYTGGTVVNGTPDASGSGKLNVYGSINPFSTGAVTLNAGAIIEAEPGSATVTNALTLNGGILQSEPQYNNYNQLTWSGPITLAANSALCQNGARNSGAGNDDQSAGVVVSGPLNVNGYTLGSYGNFSFYGGNTISGSISGSGNIIVTNNTLTVSGSNTFSGTFRAVGGTLSVQNAYALQNATLDMNPADAGAVTFSTGLNAAIGSLTGTRNLALGSGTVSIGNNNASTTYSGLLTGNNLIKVGTGTLVLSSNAYTGATTVSRGMLVVAQPNLSYGSPVTVAAGAVLELDFNATNAVSVLVLNGVSQPNGVYTSANSGGLITGIGAIQVGLTPEIWTGAFSSEWSTNILSAPKNWTFKAAQADYTDGNAVLFDDTLSANSTVNLSVANVSPANVTFNNTKTNYIIQGTYGIAGTGGMTKNGTNTLTLLNSNLFSGNLTINGGTVTVGSGGSLGTTYSGAIAMAINTALEYSGSSATLSGNITGAGALTFDSGTAGASLILSGVNTYSGLTTISNTTTGGSRLVASPASISPNTAFNILGTISGGGQLFVNGAGTFSNNMTISGFGYKETTGAQDGAIRLSPGTTLSGTITLADDSRISGVLNNGTETISGQITGNHSVDFYIYFNAASATDYLILANTNGAPPNNYTGNTYLENNFYSGSSAGNNFVLKLGASEQIPNGPGDGIVVFTGYNGNRLCTLELNGFNETVNGISNTTAGAYSIIRNTSAGASTLTVGDGNTSSSFGGTLTDGGAGKTLALVKIGSGTLTLSGANTYNGGTAINGGTLLINAANGTGTNAVNINSGGTLGGTGSIIGLVTNNSGGILMPGVGNIGKLTLSGNVTLAAGSTNSFLVNGTTAVASNSVAVGAAITYGGVLNVLTSGTFAAGQNFTLFSGAGATNVSNFATIVGNPGAGLAFSFTNGVLSVVAASGGPTLTSVSPNPVTGSSYPVSLNLTGSGFTGATAVLLTNLSANTWASYVPAVSSSTSLSVRFVPGTAASSWNATVINGTPSGQVGFTVTAPSRVRINNSSLTAAGAGKLVVSGTGGTPGNSYAVLSATNLNPPVVWTPAVTNTFDGSGNFSYTNTINAGTPELFLRIQE